MPHTFVLLAILIVLLLVFSYRHLATMKTRIEKSLSDIDVHLQKRFDLMGALFKQESEAARAFSQERAGFDRLTRTYESDKTTPVGIIKTDLAMEELFRGMQATLQKYPELESIKLISTTLTENRAIQTQLADLRQQYTRRLDAFTDSLKSFPNSLYASFVGFKADSFEPYPAEDGATDVRIEE